MDNNDIDRLLKLASSTKKSYSGGSGRKKVFEFLSNLRDTGIVNMFQSTDILWSGKVWLRKYLDLHHPRLLQSVEDGEGDEMDELRIPNVKYILDNADDVRQIIISTAMFNAEEKMGSRGVEEVDRHVRPAAQDFVRLWMQLV